MHKVIALCRQVPLLPITVLAAIPLALCWGYRPWSPRLWFLEPSVGQYCVIVLVIVTTIISLREMISDVRRGHVGVDILAVVAILSTLAVGQYWASWAVVLMIWSGDAIEAYAQSKAEQNLTLLLSAAPQTAHLADLPGVGRSRESGKAGFRAVADQDASPQSRRGSNSAAHFHTVPVDQVQPGDVLVVLPGETVPVDGELLSGSATLDLSAINGEPVPREVYAGARVMSGAVNGSDALTIRATQLAQNSQYQRILELVSSARDSRAPVVRTADRLAVPFTVLALCIAGVAWYISGDPTRFAQVLVLATPCPLLIAAPVAYMAGTGRLAHAGVLIKAQEVLENLGRVSHIFFDKTGTLTVKTPQVVRVERPRGVAAADGAEAPSDDRIVMLAGIVETYSLHILAQGIVAAGTEAGRRLRERSDAEERDTSVDTQAGCRRAHTYPVVQGVLEDSGNGIRAQVDGVEVRVGRHTYVTSGLAMGKIDPSQNFGVLAPDEMGTYVSIGGRLAARLVLTDVPRANASESLQRLRDMGVQLLTMVTGDNRDSAHVIAAEVGIDDVRAELLPEDKVNAVVNANRDHSITMMVGDGVNDAPVLAAADIGMAITDGTSTAASESAQVVIMNDDIAAVPNAISIARRTKRIMLQAVVGGLALAVLGMIAAAFNLIPVVVGAVLQEVIDVLSISWSLTALIDRD